MNEGHIAVDNLAARPPRENSRKIAFEEPAEPVFQVGLALQPGANDFRLAANGAPEQGDPKEGKQHANRDDGEDREASLESEPARPADDRNIRRRFDQDEQRVRPRRIFFACQAMVLWCTSLVRLALEHSGCSDAHPEGEAMVAVRLPEFPDPEGIQCAGGAAAAADRLHRRDP